MLCLPWGGGILSTGCYLRVSTDEQAREGVSLDAQRVRLAAHCAGRGMEVVEVVADDGVSAGTPLDRRPGGARLLSLIEGRRPAATEVVALKLDRLFRSTADGARWLDDWSRRGVGLHVLDMRGEALDTRSASGRFHLDIMISVGQWERRVIAERTALALDHLRNRRRVYGPTPFGFDRAGADGADLVPNTAEAALVQRICTMHSGGMAYAAIARTLNEEGVIGKRGGRFHASTIRYMLGNSLHAASVSGPILTRSKGCNPDA